MSQYTKAGPVTIKDLNTQAIKEVKAPYTQKELKSIIGDGTAHKNSIAELIKNDPKLLALFHKNRMQYMEDYEAITALGHGDYGV